MKITRHEKLKSCLIRGFKQCEASVTPEPQAVTDSARRADLLVEGSVVGGKVAFDVTCISIIGSAANAALTNQRNESLNGGIAGRDPLKISKTEVSRILLRKFLEKSRNCEGLDFGGVFRPWVISTGGRLYRSCHKDFLRMKKQHPREHSRMMLEIAATLAKSRGQSWMSCYADYRRADE